ncbi:3-carboxy-cis,cis-muconate cycloisomerase [Frigidibacter sp. MR17.24]|uniref:3-carboxy-cis,cis-muconate cycloisomerase n=1 Tax=Frigidibacter sp. MR17.24 TaxID=3127345 RepID=UPI003012A616
MGVTVFDHPWLSGLFTDAETAAILSPGRQMGHMLVFEAAWSRALGATGRVPAALAEDVAGIIATARIDMDDIAAGMATDGVPIPRLVAQLKALLPEGGAAALHRGATSQDVVDTAAVLALRALSDLFDARLAALVAALAQLETRFGDAPLMGRTRMQAAEPMAVRDRLLAWRLPLEGHRARLAALRPQVERVQIGGAAGDRRALGADAGAIVAHVAAELGLGATPKAWHAMREGIVDYAGWLSLVSGSLGKIGQDVALMAQQGIGEVAMSGGGGSSAMPHKQNPVAAELLVTLARFNAVQVSAMHQALVHEQERSGTAWALEWMVLPQMALATGRALAVAQDMLGRITRLGDPG